MKVLKCSVAISVLITTLIIIIVAFKDHPLDRSLIPIWTFNSHGVIRCRIRMRATWVLLAWALTHWRVCDCFPSDTAHRETPASSTPSLKCPGNASSH